MVFSYSFLPGLVWVLARLASCLALTTFLFLFHLVFIVIGLIAGIVFWGAIDGLVGWTSEMGTRSNC